MRQPNDNPFALLRKIHTIDPIMKKVDYLIIGSGIVGLSLAREIKNNFPDKKISIIEKEQHIAPHASSRNSGVLHAGFYYTINSLKAKLTARGNSLMKAYCKEKGLALNECGKLVVAQDEKEMITLHELCDRGKANGSRVEIISEAQAQKIEPNVCTFKKALWSPDTASIDPVTVNIQLYDDLQQKGVRFYLGTKYISHSHHVILTNRGEFEAKRVINCAGLYADKIAQDYGLGEDYIVIPFKGIYLKYTKNKTDVTTNIYPVPNLKNPFLGVHFTKTVSGEIKIGPTAIPAFWRENYSGSANFDKQEFLEILKEEWKLFLKNSFGFRDLAFEEFRKYSKNYMIKLAASMANNVDPKGFTEYTKPGIRAQLLNKHTRQLVQDFKVEGDELGLHILNAVSPAYTCSFAFAEMVVREYLS